MITPQIVLSSPTMNKTDAYPDSKFSSRKRRITFADPDEDDSAPAPMKELTIEIINDVWYSLDELDYFKENVKRIVLSRKVPEGEASEGLEKYDTRRMKFKFYALAYIMQAQREGCEPEFLRRVSRRCTAWARTTALNQGFHDFCEIYDPLDDLLELDSNEVEDYNECFFKGNRGTKRSTCDSHADGSDRIVRRRTLSSAA